MRSARGRLALSFVVALLVASVAAADATGKWVLTVDLGGGQGGDATFELKEEDGKITGTYNGAVGSAEVTGTANGDEVEFSFDSDAGTVSYKGKISGDSMEGTCSYGQVGEGAFKGSRSE